MERKSSAKKSLCQHQPETREQKEIRLLKKRLLKQKKLEADIRRWWAEDCKAWREAEQKLNSMRSISNNLLSAIESMQSSEGSNFRTYQLQIDMFKEMKEKAEKEAVKWKEKYDALNKNCIRGTDSNSLEILRRIGDIYKDNPSSESGDGLGSFEDRMRLIKKLTIQSYAEIIAEESNAPAENKIVHLICIKADPEGKLDEFSRYTSPGLTDHGGLLMRKYYPINELQGDIFSPRFFVISEVPAP